MAWVKPHLQFAERAPVKRHLKAPEGLAK